METKRALRHPPRIALASVVVIAVSCWVRPSRHVSLSYPPSESRPETSAAPRVQVYLGHFEDNRKMNSIIGEIYKKLGIPDFTWLSDTDVVEFLKTALTAELQNTGINAVPDDENGPEDRYRLNGSVHIFYGWGTSVSSDFTAAVNFEISIRIKSRVVMAQSYYSEKKGAKKQSDCRPLLISATTEAMRKAAGDIREFLLQGAEREEE